MTILKGQMILSKEEGVTKARSQEAKNVLARLSQVNLEGLKRVLRDMPIPEQTLRYLVPGVDINELEKTNFTFWEGDNCLSIKKGYVLVLNDLLFPKEKVHSRSSGLWKTSLYSWVYSQSRGLRRIAKCMKDTHD